MTSSVSTSKALLVDGLCLSGIGIALALAVRRAESKITRDCCVGGGVGCNGENGACALHHYRQRRSITEGDA